MIRVEALTKRFGAGPPALDSLSLEVPEGAFLVLLGPSGCGKSSLLRILAGLEKPDAGRVLLGGRLAAEGASGFSLPPAERGAGLVFQSYALWPHMTVAGNVEWPLKVAGFAAPARRARLAEVLALTGLAGLEGRYPGELSGGQQQRLALARMLAPRPRILLFDEPLSNLDAALRAEMRQELALLHAESGATAVYVTHDQTEALSLATHLAVMRAGRIEQCAPPAEVLARPATAFVARFLGTPPANLLPVREGAWFGRIPDPALRGLSGEAMVRAEDLRLFVEPGPRRLAVRRVEAIPMAGRLVVTVRIEERRFCVVADPGAPLPPELHLELPEAAPVAIFDAKGDPIP